MANENETMTVTAKDKACNTVELAKISVSFDPDKGFQIYLQSGYNFASILADRTIEKNQTIGGVKIFYPRGGNGSNLDGIAGYFRLEKDAFQAENLPNLSILLAQNLKEGVTYNFGVFPITEERIVQYINNFKQQIKMIYLSYLKPIKITAIFSTQTVETSVES